MPRWDTAVACLRLQHCGGRLAAATAGGEHATRLVDPHPLARREQDLARRMWSALLSRTPASQATMREYSWLAQFSRRLAVGSVSRPFGGRVEVETDDVTDLRLQLGVGSEPKCLGLPRLPAPQGEHETARETSHMPPCPSLEPRHCRPWTPRAPPHGHFGPEGFLPHACAYGLNDRRRSCRGTKGLVHGVGSSAAGLAAGIAAESLAGRRTSNAVMQHVITLRGRSA